MDAEEHRQTILRFVRDLTQALTDGYPEAAARQDLEACIRSARIHRKLRAEGAYGPPRIEAEVHQHDAGCFVRDGKFCPAKVAKEACPCGSPLDATGTCIAEVERLREATAAAGDRKVP